MPWALLKKCSLGPLGNIIAGLSGGGLGGQLLSLGLGGAQQTGIAGDVIGSGVGGAILMVIVGLIQSATATA